MEIIIKKSSNQRITCCSPRTSTKT